jgi:hypothetical protein
MTMGTRFAVGGVIPHVPRLRLRGAPARRDVLNTERALEDNICLEFNVVPS